jgi:hypothetical protein
MRRNGPGGVAYDEGSIVPGNDARDTVCVYHNRP